MEADKNNKSERAWPRLKRTGAVVVGFALLPFATELSEDIFAWVDGQSTTHA